MPTPRNPAKSTPPHIVERNRRNSQHSTGPRTAEGKAIARGNSLKHGLKANPAAGVIEDVDAFDQLLEGLTDRVQPRGEIEAGLVHRVAVCLWRLQRATRIDAAMSSMQCQAVQPIREQVQDLVREIWRGWHEELVWETKAEWKRRRERERNQDLPRHQKFMRPNLHSMDAYRKILMKSGAGIMAMSQLLEELYGLLEDHPKSFSMTCAELMAWLLGENAGRLTDQGDDAVVFPDEQTWRTGIDEFIGIARKRAVGEPMPTALETTVKNKLMELRCQRANCEEPIDRQPRSNRACQAAAGPRPEPRQAAHGASAILH